MGEPHTNGETGHNFSLSIYIWCVFAFSIFLPFLLPLSLKHQEPSLFLFCGEACCSDLCRFRRSSWGRIHWFRRLPSILQTDVQRETGPRGLLRLQKKERQPCSWEGKDRLQKLRNRERPGCSVTERDNTHNSHCLSNHLCKQRCTNFIHSSVHWICQHVLPGFPGLKFH